MDTLVQLAPLVVAAACLSAGLLFTRRVRPPSLAVARPTVTVQTDAEWRLDRQARHCAALRDWDQRYVAALPESERYLTSVAGIDVHLPVGPRLNLTAKEVDAATLAYVQASVAATYIPQGRVDRDGDLINYRWYAN